MQYIRRRVLIYTKILAPGSAEVKTQCSIRQLSEIQKLRDLDLDPGSGQSSAYTTGLYM